MRNPPSPAATSPSSSPRPDAGQWVYATAPCREPIERADPTTLLRCFAPVFTIDEGEKAFDRIGAPTVDRTGGRQRVFVDPEVHRVYGEVRRDRVGAVDVIQLVYRIHFTKLPFTLRVFYERHRNAGLLTIITLRADTHVPLFFTTVYTCGCYSALLPSDQLPKDVLPSKWPDDTRVIWGKKLPAFVKGADLPQSRLIVSMEARTHRVIDMQAAETLPEGVRKESELRPMEELRQLPTASGGKASFFRTTGWGRGHVRGAWSPIEGLTLGLLILDPMIGTDKDFGDPRVTGTPFYTSLLPWKRNASRLDRFGPYLEFMGFHPQKLR